MNRSAVTRKLAAILIADVVGFSRHMERDDAGTFARLREIRERIVDPKIAEYGGRVVKTAGDGMLLEFSSADAALHCAIDVQRAMHADNQSKPSDQRIEFRIGINIGDIIVDGTDIAGDGVNVASRLEALAEPGGICVSSAVREQVHGSLDVGFADIGEQQVKNIMRPLRVYQVMLGGAGAQATVADRSLHVAGQPSSTLVGRWRGTRTRRHCRGLAFAAAHQIVADASGFTASAVDCHSPVRERRRTACRQTIRGTAHQRPDDECRPRPISHRGPVEPRLGLHG